MKNLPQKLRTRLAPTPSGYLHVGNAVSFIATWAIARAKEGEILLRIDDLDRTRFREVYLTDIFDTLYWLDLDWDIGPEDEADFHANYSQLHRLDTYYEMLDCLRIKEQLYACICSRRQIAEASTNGLYPATCRNRNYPLDTESAALRLRLPPHKIIHFSEWRADKPAIDLTEAMGDFVVQRKNQRPAYQIASLADDVFWNINFIVRGNDLLHSTAAQYYMASLLNETTFLDTLFWHHPLHTDKNGDKLSKSTGATAIKTWRDEERDPAPLYQQAAMWLGLPKDTYTTPDDIVFALQDTLPS